MVDTKVAAVRASLERALDADTADEMTFYVREALQILETVDPGELEGSDHDDRRLN